MIFCRESVAPFTALGCSLTRGCRRNDKPRGVYSLAADCYYKGVRAEQCGVLVAGSSAGADLRARVRVRDRCDSLCCNKYGGVVLCCEGPGDGSECYTGGGWVH